VQPYPWETAAQLLLLQLLLVLLLLLLLLLLLPLTLPLQQQQSALQHCWLLLRMLVLQQRF
jgi:hypothetical protein